MAFPKNIWNQLRNLTKGEFEDAVKKDGWVEEPSKPGSPRVFTKLIQSPSDQTGISERLRIEIHFHKRSDTMGPKLLKGQMETTRWTEADMRRLKLVK